jgi:hypothetical protein
MEQKVGYEQLGMEVEEMGEGETEDDDEDTDTI